MITGTPTPTGRNRRWLIEPGDDFKGGDGSTIKVYRVRRKGQESHDAVNVWFSQSTVRCTKCSGLLQAMLSSCEHARAVSRYIDRNAEVRYV
jgi:hypothetical protein